MENESLPNAPLKSTVVPAKTRIWSPFFRTGLLTVFIYTLPLGWGETESCNGPARTFTGLEHMTESPEATISFGIIFLAPVLLVFLQYFARLAWGRLVFECIAAMFATFGAFYCFFSAVFQGDITHKSSREYPAPWVATAAMVLMMLDAAWGIRLQTKAMSPARKRNGEGP